MRGETESLLRPAGIMERFQYDSVGRLARNWMQTSSGGWLRDVGFKYDIRGKMLRSTDLHDATEDVRVTYSPLGHVRTSVTTTYGSEDQTGRGVRLQDRSQSMTDALGNLTNLDNWTRLTYTDHNDSHDSPYSYGAMAYEAGTGRLLARYAGIQYEEYRYDGAGNTVFTTDQNITVGDEAGTAQDRASYYDAENRLRAVDMRRKTKVYAFRYKPNDESPYYLHFEEYRYDALGRRVWVRARRTCDKDLYPAACSRSDLRRIVWDGDAELYEIQVPGGNGLPAAALENDTQQVPDQGSPNGYDLNLHYGRVLYTYGQALDKPLSVIRMNYADRKAGVYSVWPGPFALLPHWNTRGQAQRGTFASGYASLCRTLDGAQRCVTVDWPQGWFPYAPARRAPENWHGTLISEKRDASGLYYRRNRYYDPATGRFTQEDPIALAGGLNVYGYAAGDPVSYSDPFGLCPQDLTGRPCLSPLTGLGEIRIRLRTDGNPRVGQFGMTRNGGTRAHQEIDILGSRGEIIRAVDDGVVVSVRMRGDQAAYGDDITIGHRNQDGEIVSYSFYAHLHWVNPNIEPGVEVAAGDYIASMGNSGNAKGTPMHLHFELRTQNPAGRGLHGRIDPEPHLPIVR